MPDPSPEQAETGLGPLGRRLLIAFVVVSASSVLVFLVFALIGTQAGLQGLAQDEREEAAHEFAAAAAGVFASEGRWDAGIAEALAPLAQGHDAQVLVVDADGSSVGGVPPRAGDVEVSAPVLVDGTEVGQVWVSWSPGADPLTRSRTLALQRVTWAAAAGVAVAVLVGWYVAGRLTRPLRRITSVTTRFAGGDRSVRVGHHDDPGELGALATAVDRMAEAVVTEDVLRRRLVADVAHEIRTPLATMRAGLEELNDGLSEPTPRRLAVLYDQSVRLSRVVDDLAALASAEAPSPGLVRSPVDLAQVAETALAAARPLLNAGGMAVRTDLRTCPVAGDPDRLYQVVRNLLDNVVRYCREGDEVIVVTGCADGNATLQVLDDGPGIDPADLPHVTDRLYRGGNAQSVAGSGIGLAVARELVTAHGGRLEVAGREGGGTAVTVTMPTTDSGLDD